MGDDFTLSPPNAEDVARRAAILKHQFVYVACTPPPHLVAEISANWSGVEQKEFESGLEDARKRLVDSLRASGLWDYTSPSERQLLEQPSSSITERLAVDTSWRAEALHCLLWALGLVHEIPGYDVQTDPEAILPLITTEDVAGFISSARLRPHEEIKEAREIAELWHWRSRTRQLQEEGYNPREGQPSLDAIVREVAPRMVTSGMLPTSIDGDFPVLGRAYRTLAADEWAMAQSIAMERHFALNWLCGYAPDNEWDETPTDT